MDAMASRSPARPLALAALVLALAGACSSNGTTATGSGGGGNSGGGGGGATTSSFQAKLFDTDFKAVCNGASQSKAAAYDAKATGVHPVLLFAGKGDERVQKSGLPADWTIEWAADKDALAGIQLVACAERTGETFVKDCTGYESKGTATGNVVKLYDATYKVTVFAAATGKPVTDTTLTAKGKECPMFATFKSDEHTKDEYAFDLDAVQTFLKPLVQP